MDIFQRRKALADVFTAHEVEAVKAFLHPSFVVRGVDGIIVMDHAGFVKQLPAFFYSHPEYEQSVEIETSSVEGESATLATKRFEQFRTSGPSRRVCSRWRELWKKLSGEWVLAEESPNSS